MRLAVPDGFCRDEKYLFDIKPGGPGSGFSHKVIYNHLNLSDVFHKAGFSVNLLEYYDEKGEFHFIDWSPDAGKIRRSKRFDERNKDGVLMYTSLILDAYKNV